MIYSLNCPDGWLRMIAISLEVVEPFLELPARIKENASFDIPQNFTILISLKMQYPQLTPILTHLMGKT